MNSSEQTNELTRTHVWRMKEVMGSAGVASIDTARLRAREIRSEDLVLASVPEREPRC